MRKGFIGSIMLQQGKLTPAQLEQAQQIQRQQGGALDEILIGTGMLTEESYQQVLAQVYGLSFMTQSAMMTLPVEGSLLHRIPYRMAMGHLLLPWKQSTLPSCLHIVVQNPPTQDVITQLKELAEVEDVQWSLGTRDHLLDAIRHHYGAHLAIRATQKGKAINIPEEEESSEEVNVYSLRREGFCPGCGAPYDRTQPICQRCGCDPQAPQLDPFLHRVLGGRWQLRRLISQGGMGLIYEANDLKTNDVVAVKMLRTQFRSSPLEVQRFHNEARILQQLEHKNIVRTHEFGYEQSLGFYLVMELMKGEDLFNYLFQVTLPLPVICRLFIQICEGMAYAHHKGFIHRDLKPENIFLIGGIEAMEGVKVCDFGIARLLHGGQRLTQPGIVMGTPEYIAPEQAKNAPLDHRTDIYALSVILYEFLTGQRLFEAENTYAYLLKHVYTEPPPMSMRTRRAIPVELERLVMKGLAKNPKRRIQTMHDYRESLQAILARLEEQEVASAAELPAVGLTPAAKSTPTPQPSELHVPNVPDEVPVSPPTPSVSEAIMEVIEGQLFDLDEIEDTQKQQWSWVGSPSAALASVGAGSPFSMHLEREAAHKEKAEDVWDPASAPTIPEPLPGLLTTHVTLDHPAVLMAKPNEAMWLLLGGALLALVGLARLFGLF